MKEQIRGLNKKNQIRIPAAENGGIIGVYAGKLLDNPADNLFHFNLEEDLKPGDRVKLVYELQGVSDGNGVAISINDEFSRGGTWVEKSDQWSLQEQYINTASLHKGDNTLLFSLPEKATYGYQVRQLAFVVEKGNSKKLRLDNLTALSYKGEGYVSGFIEGLAPESKINIGGKAITHQNGFFETILPISNNSEKTVTITAQGQVLEQNIVMKPVSVMHQEPISNVLSGSSKTFIKGQKMMLAVGAASIEVNNTALLENKTLSITPLRTLDLPALDPMMTNLTNGRGYRFLPHGEHFAEGALVKLGYNKELLPPGYTEDDIRTFFFDKNTGHWEALERDSLDVKNQVIISKTTHFTDMINGVIKTPESPDTQGFAATMMNDIKAADPTAAVQTIQPPTANQQGSTNLSYTIEVPPARNGMQPNINIAYNSDGGSGWLGEGWDIHTPKIAVDTRWGVPRYSTTQETETYSFNGAMLVQIDNETATVAHRGEKITRKTGSVQFYPRIEGDFSKIIRKGTNPKDYTWEVTDKSGTVYLYSQQLKGDNGNIAEWFLTNVTELHGDMMKYNYTTSDETIQGNVKAKAVYLNSIEFANGNSLVSFQNNGIKTVKTSSGRYGFLTSQQKLLTKVTVIHLGKTLRSYDLVYKNNDGAFKKTLLEKIVQNDASGAKFNEHIFEYYDDVKAAEGYVPFNNNTENWNTGADNITGNGIITKADKVVGEVLFNDKISALGGGVSTSGGFSLYVGVGLTDGQATTSNTAGASFSFSPSESKGLLALVDINGDGLADKVFSDSGRIYYRPNLGSNTFGERLEINGISTISLTKSSALSYGASIKIGLGKAMATGGTSVQTSKTTNSIYFQDVNNDGLVDLVRNGVVYFNHIVNLNGNPIPTFTTSSFDTASPIKAGGNIDTSVTAVDPAEQAEAYSNAPLHDVVRVWEAPFAGTIKIESTATLIPPTGDYDQTEYALADGVFVGIQKGALQIVAPKPLTKTSASATLSSASLTVVKGEKIYFRVQSGIEDSANGAFDQVNWDPVITYTDASRTGLPTNPDGQQRFSYKATEGFVLDNNPANFVMQKANEAGAVQITGTFTKPVTSDAVTVNLLGKNSLGGFDVLWCRTFAATQTYNTTLTAKTLLPAISDDYQELKIAITSETNVAWDKIQWDAKLSHYTLGSYSTINPVPTDVNCTGVDKVTITGVSDYETVPFKDYSLFASHLAEGNLYTATSSGQLSIVPTLKAVNTNGIVYKVTLSAKTSAGILLGKNNYSIVNGIIATATPLTVTTNTGDKIWIEYTISDRAALGVITTATTTVSVNGTSVAAAVFAPVTTDMEKFGPMQRHWGQFIYNAMNGRNKQPIDESKLVLPDSKDQADPRTMVFNMMTPDVTTKKYWSGADDLTYINSAIVSSSRLGEDNVILTNPLDGLTAGAVNTNNPYCTEGTAAFGVSKITKGKSISTQTGVSPFTASSAEGTSEVITDFQDMNGDGFPDIITKGNIQLTNSKGGFDGENITISGLHTSTSNSYGLSAGSAAKHAAAINTAQIAFNAAKAIEAAANCENEPQAIKDSQNAEAALDAAKSKIVVSGGADYNKEETVQTWTDINGDGLPDKILSSKKVQLNLGYSFTEPIDYGLLDITKAESISPNFGLGFDFGSSSFSGGYGIVKNITWNDFSLQDVNGDGLVDQVFKNDLVRLNLGDRYNDPMPWNGLGILGKGSSTAESLNASFNIPVTILAVKVAINPGVNVGLSSNRTESTLQDIDGDGFPDYLTSTEDSNMTVKRSTIARTNKLKAVHNPLGGEFIVDYSRSMPTYDHPGGKWVLQSVVVKDGIASDGPDMKTQFAYAKGKYERHERSFLGFGEVKTQNIDTENGDKVYRTLTQNYDVSDYYNAGQLLSSVVASNEGADSTVNIGAKYSESTQEYFTYLVKALEDKYEFSPVSKMCSDRGVSFNPIKKIVSSVYEGGTNPLKLSEINNEYYVSKGTYGGLKSYTYKDNSTGNYKTDIGYIANLQKHILNVPLSSKVTMGGVTVHEIGATYDMNFAHLNQVRQKLNSSEWAVTDLKYDAYGNVTQKTLPANYKNERPFYKYRYDSQFNMYVEEISDNFEYRSYARNYDSRYGIALETEDVNGYLIKKEIDEFGRLTKVQGPKEAAIGQPYTIMMDYFPTTAVSNGNITRTAYARTKHFDAQRPSDPIETVTFVDGLGRAIQVKKDGGITNNKTPDQQSDVMVVSGRAKFDAFGRVKAAYYPQTAPLADWNKFMDSFDSVEPSRTTYDILDRPVTTTLPDGASTQMKYTIEGDLLKTEVTDALNNTNSSYANGSGLTMKTLDANNVVTQFGYDGIGRNITVTDAQGQQTVSTYDFADRRTQVVQPDAGKSIFKFDALGNLLERQTANLEAKSKKITYEYEFNRLTNIHYPEHPENDVRYVFGSKNESQNRKGRLMLMEDMTGAQEFSYGVMGEIESIRRTLIVPNSAIATYVTSWKYDSWNRLQEMIYPDQEKVSYSYNSGGLLQAVAGKKAYSYNYVNKIGYDKFEQRSYLKYCNGTETKYDYEPLRRRLDNMTVASGTGYQDTNTPRMFMNNKYQYDKISNVLNVTNSAAGVTNKMGGIMTHNYSYDNLYQLTAANGVYTGADQKTANYNLEMKYDDLHNIVSKTQNVVQNKVTETGLLKAGYTMNYNYNSTNKHQLDNVAETEYRTKNTDPKVDRQKDNKYTYDKNGNMIYVNTEEVRVNGQVAEKAQEKKLIWDEENRLRAIDINGYVSNYTYDAGGERVTKLSGGGQGIFVNSVFSGGKTSTSDFTLYVNPYLVAQNGGRYTKHIYIGSQRIVSKIGDFDSYGADPRRVEKAGESFSGVKVNYDAKYKKALEVVKASYDTFEVPYYGTDNNDYVNGLGFCCNPSGDTGSGGSPTGKMAKNDNAELQQFYYHPDHLGSSSYITNLDGEVVQHIEYVPFGEVFLEEKNAKWNTPYLFTSKELDRETGMYYFGARYQDPKLGIFISVDPMSLKYPNISPYAYCVNNPINMIDPDGRDWYRNYETGKIIWRDGNSKIKGYAHLGYSWGKTFANGNRILLDGERKQIIYNGSHIVADYNKKKTSGSNGGGMAISDGGNNQDPSSLDKGGRSVEWFDYKGTLDVIIALLANELRGLKLGRATAEDKINDGINAIDNASNAIKTIKGAAEEKIDMQIKNYTTTDILRDNDSQVHEGKPRDTSVIHSDSAKINALNKRNYNIKKQEAERKNIIYRQSR
ncbi:SpvB/TcaC N-terminal domain-containing protein [Flavobacterium sp. LHD-85]|uniref:SpvB/TcaC N-terminal domain-containing protein n=1 Tax=Flavobacterium sp. LHD-85 TaxID=3071410 RepID=UPI0027DFCEE2|nr:SpvB/TcaC N-terminal domain-containing protein [Flavobacterium sp. LHD-85]MDQ6528091.1 SpvB/TcaC N-terminal domain-containing protein [Flavobacterium sp. LHD-85]